MVVINVIFVAIISYILTFSSETLADRFLSQPVLG